MCVLYGKDSGAVVAELRPRLRLCQWVRGIGAPNENVIRQQVADQDVGKHTKMDGDLVPEPGLSTSVLWAGAWALSCRSIAPPANGCPRLPRCPGHERASVCRGI